MHTGIRAGPPPMVASIRSSWATTSTISTGAFPGVSVARLASFEIDPRSTVGYATTMSSKPSSARYSASGRVKARMPRKPASSERTRRSTSTERTDFDAMRIGRPPACSSIEAALARTASRSTKANGGAIASKIAS